MPTTRAQKADDTIVEDLKISFITKVEHYEHSERLVGEMKERHCHKNTLVEKKN